MTLRDYARKRRFAETPEPADDAAVRKRGRGAHRPIFVVQLHNARARHYDFRLEADGALKSWAVPKGPSLRAGEKRLAVQVEDHPLSYAGFQGEIPEGNYGAGHVLVFDHGVWACEGDPLAGIAAGKLDFTLEGGKLRGAWKLVRTGMQGGRGAGKAQWLLIKRDDAHARDAEADDLVDVEPGPESSSGVAKHGSKSLVPTGEEPALEALSVGGGAKRRMRVRRSDATTTPDKIEKKRAPDTSTRYRNKTWKKRALALQGASDEPFPPGFKPELATLRQHAPKGDDWLHEIKWDGYRMLADLVDGTVKLRSRNDLGWTADFPGIVEAIESLPVSDARLDGELIALGTAGLSDFALLQRTLQGTRKASLRYVVFDLPGVAGVDLSQAPLLARKELLQALLGDATDGPLLYSQHVRGHGEEVFNASGAQGLEGIISKRVDSPYTQARSAHWVKTKHAEGDDFVIVGYSAPKGSRTGFGALLLATPDDDGLRYVGRVGTGFTDTVLKTLYATLTKIERKGATVALPDHLPYDKRDRGDIHWVKPQLIAEVAYRGWGKDGLLRQSSFQRLRTDKRLEDLRMPDTDRKSTNRRDVGAKPVDKASGGEATSAVKRAAKPDATKQAATKKSHSLKRASKASASAAARSTAKIQKSSSPQRKLGSILTSAVEAEDQNGSQLPLGRRKRGTREKVDASRWPQVQISSRDRLVFQSAGLTKGDVADYYAAVADLLLPGIADRPLSLLRCPRGAAAECFFQKHHAESLGAHVRVVPIDTASGTDDYLTVRDASGLLELVQMNALEFHPWGAKVDKPERPDMLVFDLDPGPGVGWKDVVAAARDVRARLQDASLDSFVRLSGGKGVHVVVPIRRGPTWDQAKDFSGAFAEAMAAHRPLQYVASMSKAKRTGRIFIDWLRNGRGATSVCSWSLRAREGAPVAMPIRWEELGRVSGPDAFDLHKALKRAKTLKVDPWEGYAATRQALPKLG
jgi:bifunctional non-homologous end joining protein LigD